MPIRIASVVLTVDILSTSIRLLVFFRMSEIGNLIYAVTITYIFVRVLNKDQTIRLAALIGSLLLILSGVICLFLALSDAKYHSPFILSTTYLFCHIVWPIAVGGISSWALLNRETAKYFGDGKPVANVFTER